MANFLRSFATGFISSANERFREDRALQISNDAAKAKLIRDKILPDYQSIKISGPRAKKAEAESAALLGQLPLGPGGGLAQGMVGAGVLEPGQVSEFLQNLPPDVRKQLAADPFSFTPGQTGKPSLEEFAKQRGVSVEDLTKAGIDPSQFTGQPTVAAGLTGGPTGFDVTQAAPSPQEQRVQNLATTFITKANMFTSDKDFQQAKIAFQREDFETVIDLTARSPNLQNNIFLPIIEKVLTTGMKSLSPNERIVLDLYRPRDPLDQMMNMLILQNSDTFEKLIQKGINKGTLTEPPSDKELEKLIQKEISGDPPEKLLLKWREKLLEWWEQNIGPLFNIAREEWDKIILGHSEPSKGPSDSGTRGR